MAVANNCLYRNYRRSGESYSTVLGTISGGGDLNRFSVRWWHDRFYPPSTFRNGGMVVMELLQAQIHPEARILDIGAGAGELNAYNFKGRCKEVVGVDFDPRVTTNPLLDQGLQMTTPRLPVADGIFDMAFSVFVLEHIENPTEFIAEIHRVLKPGGVFIALTPNARHYVPLFASMTPMWFHKWYNRKRGRHDEDTFPTLYRMNTRRRLRKQFEAGGFKPVHLLAIEGRPAYLLFSLPSFLIGVAYERLVNCCQLFAPFRTHIVCQFEKIKVT